MYNIKKNMKNRYSQFLKTHGIILLCLGAIMTVQTLLGSFKGIGILAFTYGDALRSVGLFEAYLLAGFCGGVFIALSGRHYVKQWHLLAALVHLILFTTNMLFWRAYALADIVLVGYVSTTAHAVFILLESASYFMQPGSGANPTPADLLND